jgi:hypothetical protein
LVELESALAKSPDIETAMRVLDDGLKTRLPKELYDVLLPHLIEPFKEISSGAVKTAKEGKSQALDFFERATNYDYGKIYADNRSNLQKAVETELSGKPSSPAEAMEAAKQAALKVGKTMSSGALFNRYRMVVAGAVMKVRNFSQVMSYEELGFSHLEVVAILDQKTSAVCKEMNGRRIAVSSAVEYVRDYMSAPPTSVSKKFSWPDSGSFSQLRGKATSEIVESLACKLPPYHGNCRTTVVPGYTERVVNNRGTEFKWENRQNPKFDHDSIFSKSEIKKAKISNDERKKEYINLSPDEFASKINAVRHSKWNGDLLDEKFASHGAEFDGFTKPRYKEKAEDILGGKFDAVYIYRYNGNDRVMFFNDKEQIGVFVDSTENSIVNMYRIDDDTKKFYENIYIKLK